jgi:broad specificity phosphatase PhoE
MGKPTTIYLVRHGESEMNRQALLAGQLDPDLTELGIRQAQETRQALVQVNFDKVYSSDLKRAVRTAEIIAGSTVPKANQLPGLRERTYGVLQGLSNRLLDETESFKSTLPHEERWLYRNAEGMETDRELADRFLGTLRSVAEINRGASLLVVAHGGPIRMTLMEVGGYGHDDLPRGSFKNAGVIEMLYSNSFIIKSINGSRV